MRAKLRAVKTELILLIMTAVFLFGLSGLARRDRMAADTAAVSAVTEEKLPPEQVELTLVDINTAGVEELSTLPGIGEGLAGRIVRYREANGAFESVEALTEVSGIGEKKLEELRDYITVNEGAQP